LILLDSRTDELARREHIMLVLSRRIGEEIVIADEIRVAIIGVKGQRVRVGITAPRSVTVARSELLAQNPDGGRLQANARPGT
jgi:carbon storage regulator